MTTAIVKGSKLPQVRFIRGKKESRELQEQIERDFGKGKLLKL